MTGKLHNVEAIEISYDKKVPIVIVENVDGTCDYIIQFADSKLWDKFRKEAEKLKLSPEELFKLKLGLRD